MEVIPINTIVTSKEAILEACRQLVSQKGLEALNMREVAASCHVALGSLYNYFPSKGELIAAAIESVWQDIFQMGKECRATASYPEYVGWIFERVQQGTLQYPHFFSAHSLSFSSPEKGRARQVMERYFSHMKSGMMQALQGDSSVKTMAFRAGFSQEDFVEFTLSALLSLLVQQNSSCEILLEVIRRAIY